MATKIKRKIRTSKIDKPENEYTYTVPLKTSRDRNRCIKRIESIIRSSQEYRDYIQYLKNYVDMNACAFFSNVNNADAENKKIKIEIHHEPFTLRDYTETVLNKYISEGFPINESLIADEVMHIHYNNEVGLIPLSRTIHQMVHKSNKITIPLYMVYGKYSQFISEYSDYVTDEMIEKLERKIEKTKSLNEDSFDALNCQFEYIETEGVDQAKKMDSEESMDAAISA